MSEAAKRWALYTADGGELGVGWVGVEEHARARAQEWANDLGISVELCLFGKSNGEWFKPETDR